MKKHITLSALITCIFFIASCSNPENDIINTSNQEECEELANLGFIAMNETSKTFIPYPKSITKVIMKDSLDNEHVGIVSGYNEIYDPTTLGGIEEQCPIDPSILIEYNYKSEYIRLSIEFQILDIKLSMLLGTTLSNSSYQDKLVADHFSTNVLRPIESFGSNANMTIVVDPRTHPNPYTSFSTYQDIYQLGNSTYNNVYIKDIDTEGEFEIVYNSDVGLIRLRSEGDEEVDLRFERIE